MSTQTVDPKKLDKYLHRLLNGEANKLEAWLPNLVSGNGITDREKYDYRIGQYRRQNPASYNTNIHTLVTKLERMRQQKTEIINDLAKLKTDTDTHHEKLHGKPLI